MARMRCAPMINSAPRRPNSESMSKKPPDQSVITLEGLLDAAQARGLLINKLGQFEDVGGAQASMMGNRSMNSERVRQLSRPSWPPSKTQSPK